MEDIPLNSISNSNYHDPNEKQRISLMENGTQEPKGGNTFGTGASIDRFSNPRKSNFFGSNRKFSIKIKSPQKSSLNPNSVNTSSCEVAKHLRFLKSRKNAAMLCMGIVCILLFVVILTFIPSLNDIKKSCDKFNILEDYGSTKAANYTKVLPIPSDRIR